MIYLRLRRYQQAIDSLQTGIDSCLWYPQKSYFKTALALARLQQENAEGAAELASEIDDLELQIPTNVIRVHAFGKVDKAEEAATAFRALPDVLPFAGRELKRELHRRFIARTGGQHDDDWLYEQEWRLLAAA